MVQKMSAVMWIILEKMDKVIKLVLLLLYDYISMGISVESSFLVAFTFSLLNVSNYIKKKLFHCWLLVIIEIAIFQYYYNRQ